MAHTQPALPYAYDALEPFIDTTTMQLHYVKHHGSAVDTLNKGIAGTDAENLPLTELLANISAYPAAVRNSAGSHYNHSLFWAVLGPAGTQPGGQLAEAIDVAFGSLDGLKQAVSTAGAGLFGSGWVWLIVQNGKLTVTTTPNQDNPLMDIAPVKGIHILGIDVFEHAYLKYHNRPAEYLTNLWNVINWAEVERRYLVSV